MFGRGSHTRHQKSFSNFLPSKQKNAVRFFLLHRAGSRPFFRWASAPPICRLSPPPKTIISYLNDQASTASSRKFIILAHLSISMWYSRAVIDRQCARRHVNEARTHWEALHGQHASTKSQPGLMKVRFNGTIFCFYLVCLWNEPS